MVFTGTVGMVHNVLDGKNPTWKGTAMSEATGTKFEVGKTYIASNLGGYHDTYKVLRRTKCFIVTNHGRFKVRTDSRSGEEYFVVGSYAWAPAVRAGREYDSEHPEKYLSDFDRAMMGTV